MSTITAAVVQTAPEFSATQTNIEQALAAAEGNRSCAAEALGIDRSTLRRKLKRHGLADDGD